MNRPLPTVDTAASLQLTDDVRQRCEIWTRVMGYHRPVSSFNKGKKSEFSERAAFAEGKSLADAG